MCLLFPSVPLAIARRAIVTDAPSTTCIYHLFSCGHAGQWFSKCTCCLVLSDSYSSPSHVKSGYCSVTMVRRFTIFRIPFRHIHSPPDRSPTRRRDLSSRKGNLGTHQSISHLQDPWQVHTYFTLLLTSARLLTVYSSWAYRPSNVWKRFQFSSSRILIVNGKMGEDVATPRGPYTRACIKSGRARWLLISLRLCQVKHGRWLIVYCGGTDVASG